MKVGTLRGSLTLTFPDAEPLNLGTIDIPGNSHEKRADWLMGFWEQLTDYMAEYADKDHLTEYVQRAANPSGTRQ